MPTQLQRMPIADLTPQSLTTQVIEPVLYHLDPVIPFSPAAAKLLLGTALKESQQLRYRRQLGGGPARGYFQMEPATHDDIWENYLAYRKKLSALVTSLMTDMHDSNKLYELEHNDNYAAGMARIHYYRQPAALPPPGDIGGMADYWKQYYNTVLGKGRAEQFLEHWMHANASELKFREG